MARNENGYVTESLASAICSASSSAACSSLPLLASVGFDGPFRAFWRPESSSAIWASENAAAPVGRSVGGRDSAAWPAGLWSCTPAASAASLSTSATPSSMRLPWSFASWSGSWEFGTTKLYPASGPQTRIRCPDWPRIHPNHNRMLLDGGGVNRLSGPDPESPERDRTQRNAGRSAPRRMPHSMEEAGHHVNDQRNDHCSVEVGEHSRPLCAVGSAKAGIRCLPLALSTPTPTRCRPCCPRCPGR